MKHIAFLILTMVLSGCVGLTVASSDLNAPKTNWTKSNDSNSFIGKTKSEVEKAIGRPSQIQNLTDKELWLFTSHGHWCGMALLLIVPVPLMLPLCSEKTELELTNGVVTKESEYTLKKSAYYCMAMPTHDGFCHDEHW